MTDEQIVHELEDCAWWQKQNGGPNMARLMDKAANLINRQKAEIERLTKLLDKKCDRCISKNRADAIKEFAEKIKRYIADCVSSGYAVEISDEEIDEIAKGMTEEQEDD